MIKVRISGFLKNTTQIIGILAGIAAILTLIFNVLPKEDNSINLSGHWEMTFNVEKSSLGTYENGNFEYKYKISVIQRGSDIEGSGEKFWEKINGVETFYTRNQKTPIEIKGTIRNRVLTATIIEEGALRKTTGYIEFNIKKGNTDRMQGKFNTTAANSSGTSILEKL